MTEKDLLDTLLLIVQGLDAEHKRLSGHSFIWGGDGGCNTCLSLCHAHESIVKAYEMTCTSASAVVKDGSSPA